MIRVTFQMRTPLIISEPLHLDALLTAVHPAAKLITGVMADLRDGCLSSLPLPLKKAGTGQSLVWAASSISLDGAVKPFRGSHTKRKSKDDMFRLKANVMTIGGVLKDWLIADSGYVAPACSFLACESSLPELEALCARVTHIGKLRGMGYGRVAAFELEESDLPWQECLVQNGRAARTLPESMLKTSGLSFVNIDPPYWDMARRVQGAAPGDECALCEGVALC